MISVLQFGKVYILNEDENMAIDEALKYPEGERRLTKEQVVVESKQKYPTL